ncbi:methylated-DNA--[protein]-cysteine S-methyltransferase [Paraglaciecola sp.]|uniref:methylated-DNA--[protein]-cysteine S-methyltransferase n=1 Tax=Paraglaciecola sp. TaxID=1920173 RepID=UPI003EF89D18
MNKPKHYTQYLNSSFGNIEIQASNKGLTSLRFNQAESGTNITNEHTENAAIQLVEYFDAQRTSFNLAFDVQGTEFQQKVWGQLMQIPYGETSSYANIAKRINNPKAVRAVGTANGRNPIAIIVPCHRVIGSNGSLTGYAWGTQLKQQLLELEKQVRVNDSAN